MLCSILRTRCCWVSSRLVRAKTSVCTLSAASGLRSSWAASAVKRNSRARVCSMRWSKSFSAVIMGWISVGTVNTPLLVQASSGKSYCLF
ncbi:hypothetical protein [Snodgrassella sp.]|uniref:hypothetical protein n=1 Tax=Snodgrassella sp. TaxID=2815304 RepID=UPI00258CE945|nr:hypothetical protein [Snodgrassella sp.]